jgi:hypothetical protein
MDKRYDFYMMVSESALDKLEEQRNKMDLITYCLENLEGCEKLYGLMFIFTQLGDLDDNDELNLIKTTSLLIIGDMVELDDDLINEIIDKAIDNFYSFDKLKDGYLVTHNFDEMKNYLDMRINLADNKIE